MDTLPTEILDTIASLSNQHLNVLCRSTRHCRPSQFSISSSRLGRGWPQASAGAKAALMVATSSLEPAHILNAIDPRNRWWVVRQHIGARPWSHTNYLWIYLMGMWDPYDQADGVSERREFISSLRLWGAV